MVLDIGLIVMNVHFEYKTQFVRFSILHMLVFSKRQISGPYFVIVEIDTAHD